jgi:flagella basal body P-ring formation protein FlgA
MRARRRRERVSAQALCLLLSLPLSLLAPSRAVAASPAGRQAPAMVAAAVQQAVSDTAPANAAITLGPVAGAQFMPACTAPLSVTVSGLEPYLQAAAHCPRPSWTLYVSVTVDSRMAVVVAARPIAGGEAMTPDDLTLREEPLSLYAGRQVFYHPADVVGATAILSLPRGTIITGTAIQQPIVVQAGQTIAVDVQSGGVDLTLDAQAEQSGRIGDSILVTNPESGKRFEATVTATGAVVQLEP